MGFFQQLGLLLWKNASVKWRRPFVLVVELFIPLVLFLVLWAIRGRHSPSHHAAPSHVAMPLPSAGILPVMQAFCEPSQKDSHGFMVFSNDSSDVFLKRLDFVAKHNDFFQPQFTPLDLQHMPDLYKEVIDIPMGIYEKWRNGTGNTFDGLFSRPGALKTFLVRTLSFTEEQAEAFIGARLNPSQLLKILLLPDTLPPPPLDDDDDDASRERRGVLGQGLPKLAPFLGNQLSRGLLGVIMNSSDDSALSHAVLRSLGLVLGLADGSAEKLATPERQMIANTLEDVLLSPAGLKYVFCQTDNFTSVFLPASSDPLALVAMRSFQQHVCSLSASQVVELTKKLHLHVENVEKISEKLELPPIDPSILRTVERFKKDLTVFMAFQRNLYELSELAAPLSRDACNATTRVSNATKIEQELPMLGNQKFATSSEQIAGLMHVWMAMERVVCGKERQEKKEPQGKDEGQQEQEEEKKKQRSRQITLDDLDLTKHQKMQIGILFHMLTSNPKILYAPNNTKADVIMEKTNQTLAVLGTISEYINKWPNVSLSIKRYLDSGLSAKHLDAMKEIQRQLREQPYLLELFGNAHLSYFALNLTIPSVLDYRERVQTVDRAACSWHNNVKNVSFNMIQGFGTEKEAVDFALTKAWDHNATVFATVVFDVTEEGEIPPHTVYKIRQNASLTFSTLAVRPKYWYPGDRLWAYNYYDFGFIWLQDMIDRAIIDYQSGRDVLEPGTYVQQMPYPCFVGDRFITLIEHVMPLLMTISWVYSVSMLVQAIVYEKETRLKEVMRMMGMSNFVHWVAWFLTALLQMTVVMTCVTLILHYSAILKYSNPWVIFFILMVFAVTTIMFSFLTSALCSKAKVAAACAGIGYFMTYVPYMYIVIKEGLALVHVPYIAKALASLLHTSGFGLAAKYIAYYEEEGEGVQWHNLARSPMDNDSFSIQAVLMMMAVDSVLYGLLLWYIENVFPGAYGMPRPWYFPVTRSYWCPQRYSVTRSPPRRSRCSSLRRLGARIAACWTSDGISVTEQDQAGAMTANDETCFESDPHHLPVGVAIQNLTKWYKTGWRRKKVAVRQLNMNFYENQISAFLGHNGAGKTTTLSILTGLYPPSEGTALIYGEDICEDMDVIRSSLGFCPQHNVLFDRLTVEEHLWFYAKLKGIPSENIQSEINRMLQDIDMTDKRYSTVDALSGGMKRKLSVAIAFVAGSKVVILDEPTAGVDPYARRAIWDLLIKYKKGRTIIVSTHHMDEAEVLGDRIAILAMGQLKCCGSPLFLKTRFGEGYTLTLVRNTRDVDALPEQPEESDSPLLLSLDQLEEDFVPWVLRDDVTSAQAGGAAASADEKRKQGLEARVTSFVQKHVGSAYLKEATNTELQYVLPFEEASKGNFEKLFIGLDQNLQRLRVTEYGVADTLLEEVFMKVTRSAIGGDNDDLEKVSQHLRERLGRGARATSVFARSSEADHVRGWRLHARHVRAILLKRWHYARRSWRALLSQILLPAIFITIAMTVSLSAPSMDDLPPLELTPSQYYPYLHDEGQFMPISNELLTPAVFRTRDAMPTKILETFRMPSGIGATCVLKDTKNGTFYEKLVQVAREEKNVQLLEQYYNAGCGKSFTSGVTYKPRLPPRIDGMNDSTITPSVPSSGILYTVIDENATKSELQTRYSPDCHCGNNYRSFVCDNLYTLPSSFPTVTGEILQNITTDNTSIFLQNTNQQYRMSRFGGISVGMSRGFIPDDFGRTGPTEFKRIAVKRAAKAWYNHKGYHAMPTFLNVLNNAILRANLPESRGNPAAYGISVINHPMNHSNSEFTMRISEILQGSDVLNALFIIIALSFVPASFVVFLVYERATSAKHLQIISGVHPVVYWLTNYLWDMCNYIPSAVTCILILKLFNVAAYAGNNNFSAVVYLFLLYGWSITPMMYPFSFRFSEPSSAYVFLIVANLFIGMTCIMITFMLQLFTSDDVLDEVNLYLKDVFLIFPNFCLGRGLIDIAFMEYHNMYYIKTGQYGSVQTALEWNVAGKNLFAMALTGVVFFCFTLLCEWLSHEPWARRHKGGRSQDVMEALISSEDGDVANERRRVLRGAAASDVLKVEGLTKVYKTRKLGRHLAVENLTFGVPAGECFGLLGVNGAGKSTTFKMLSGQLLPTSGNAHVAGFSVTGEEQETYRHIGYCPQFDALFDELTALEHLLLYARLRGIPATREMQVAEGAIDLMNLGQFKDRPAGTYSGGNRRKLSAALTLIGQPSLVFLDEPTTGMDPVASRFLWSVIRRMVSEGRSVVLTSHSMEECEALCTRLAIMVNGAFQCIGSPQHLKNRFGDGYTVSIRAQEPNVDRALYSAWRFMKRRFPKAKTKSKHHNLARFELTSDCGVHLSELFGQLETLCRDYPVKDYSVTQNTLDNVFLNFVRKQMEVREASEEEEAPAAGHGRQVSDTSTIMFGLGSNISIPHLPGPRVYPQERKKLGHRRVLSNGGPVALATAKDPERFKPGHRRALSDGRGLVHFTNLPDFAGAEGLSPTNQLSPPPHPTVAGLRHRRQGSNASSTSDYDVECDIGCTGGIPLTNCSRGHSSCIGDSPSSRRGTGSERNNLISFDSLSPDHARGQWRDDSDVVSLDQFIQSIKGEGHVTDRGTEPEVLPLMSTCRDDSVA